MTMIPLGSRESGLADNCTVFQVLGGEIAAVDPWTRVDFSVLPDGAASEERDLIGYRGLTMPYRVAGLTLGDADAAPVCDGFEIAIASDRLTARFCCASSRVSDRDETDMTALSRWAAGSLSKHLRVVQFDDGDLGLEAELHLAPCTPAAALREFVTAFSWDVAALQASTTGGELRTTEEWVRRATLSISRATPQIPLREQHGSADWPSSGSPRGVFCHLQPAGGLAESDNVLYVVRGDAAVMEPVATMPGHRADWDVARLTDVWLSRAGTELIARSLLCEGVRRTDAGAWEPIACGAVTAIAPHGAHGFLLGLHDGRVALLNQSQAVASQHRIAHCAGRFSHLVSSGTHVMGLIGDTVVGARLPSSHGARISATARWSTPLGSRLSFEGVTDLDVDPWSVRPALAVLGDAGLVLLDAATGAVHAEFQSVQGRIARWIGPGWLLVVSTRERPHGAHSLLRVLDVNASRWTEPLEMHGEIAVLAVRDDEIHVGWANQSIAVWNRAAVCRGTGITDFATPWPPPAPPAVG
ncbi:MAG: hypothetical protein IT355_01370 [Gemmatimonadaceae bacterium]|nr:hypothetical protein [Gemmatimonadaceae bacterium]